MKMVHQPSGLTKGLDFLIACDWTPEQALAIIELLSDLQDRILNHYQLPILALMREEHGISEFDELNITDLWGENELPF
jgi:hypothetical protein